MRRVLAVLAASWAAASVAWWIRGRRRKGREHAGPADATPGAAGDAPNTPPAP